MTDVKGQSTRLASLKQLECSVESGHKKGYEIYVWVQTVCLFLG